MKPGAGAILKVFDVNDKEYRTEILWSEHPLQDGARTVPGMDSPK